jgi:hypothetical protein
VEEFLDIHVIYPNAVKRGPYRNRAGASPSRPLSFSSTISVRSSSMTLPELLSQFMPDAHTHDSKRRRITKACDFCHRRGRRCRPAEHNSNACMTCVDHGAICTWDRIAARRGAKPRSTLRRSSSKQSRTWILQDERHGTRMQRQVLIDVFFKDVYPMYAFPPSIARQTE